jgi:ABC-type Na+ efflux pump permease subunit
VNPIWLIAGREFRAYTTTASFWIALVTGPALAAGAVALASGQAAHAPPATLTLAAAPVGGFEARFSDPFPTSAAARSELVRIIAADGQLKGPLRLAAPAPAKPDNGAVARFALTLALWMTLTGSLGMLLQAVVRERATRALESLLAAARPIEIVLGKLLGVGAVSAVVAAIWLAAGACAGGGARIPLLAAFADPATLARALGLYALGFTFYGLVTVAIGARARDSADAQNLARPMFAVLLVVFFATLAAASGARGLDGLVFLPPFTPFMLLMRPAGALVEGAALAILAVGTAAAAWLAATSVGFEQTGFQTGSAQRDR